MGLWLTVYGLLSRLKLRFALGLRRLLFGGRVAECRRPVARRGPNGEANRLVVEKGGAPDRSGRDVC